MNRDAIYKIVDPRTTKVWWGRKIKAQRYKAFSPKFIVHYTNPFDYNPDTLHIQAINIDKYNIECLTKEAYSELAEAKKKYESLKTI